MTRNNIIWIEIEKEQKQYDNLNLFDVRDYNKFYLYSIITHSTAIEGSTLSERDVQMLFDEGLTSQEGKPIYDYLMNLDLKTAYEFAFEHAKKKTLVSSNFLKQINSFVMKNTGGINNTVAGTFDSCKGDYRLCNVTAGFEGHSYMNYQKIPSEVEKLCSEINKFKNETPNIKDAYNLSFDAHLNLVTIHPWVDGNGRTSRLFMNYIQYCLGVTQTKIRIQDKDDYIKALKKSQDSKSPEPFREFMAIQQLKTLQEEVSNYLASQKKSEEFQLLF